MSYGQFKISQLIETFGITIIHVPDFFLNVSEVEVSDLLQQVLRQNLPFAETARTEKSLSEWLISPILTDLCAKPNRRLGLFSGVEFNVDHGRGMKGECDFIISLSNQRYEITAPVVVVVEAKKGDISLGIPQCIAEMIAVTLFNEQQQKQIKKIFGVITTGITWKFLQMENSDVTIDLHEYSIMDKLGKIVGILVSMVS